MHEVSSQLEGLKLTEAVIASSGKWLGKKIKELMTLTVDLGGNSGETNLVKALTPLFDMRLRKLDILVFEGANPYGWLHQVEHILLIDCRSWRNWMQRCCAWMEWHCIGTIVQNDSVGSKVGWNSDN